jgi:excisionase family DNA binding protein
MESNLLTKEDVEAYLRIGRRTLDRLIKTREIPFIKLGRRVLFKKVDIDAWLESKRVK